MTDHLLNDTYDVADSRAPTQGSSCLSVPLRRIRTSRTKSCGMWVTASADCTFSASPCAPRTCFRKRRVARSSGAITTASEVYRTPA